MINDYYGDKMKWFIEVVKDVSNPNNMVRVRIKGIHAEDPQGDGVGGGSSLSSSSATTPGSGVGNSTTPSGGGGGSTLPALENLPNSATQSSSKISKHWTLGQLTTQATVSGPSVRPHINAITPTVIKNLSLVAVNILDPIKEKFPGVTVTSGWRPPARDRSGQHRTGFAVDIQAMNMSGKGIDTIYNWIKNEPSMRGKFSFLFHEHNHVHLQYEGGHGTRENPVIKIKGS